ncbi:MAG TPA: tRNA 2-thiouridine(34) synthase MnmA, partial [Bacillota bacterium]|nr:tRNA 2-thiouridine(34) synthase MnmA [Bacillota bacterium]
MSGGVDSSVAAALLLEQGYEVIGVTMQIWPQPDKEGACCSLSAVEDARRVAAKLDIPYYVLNFQDLFEKEVIENFCSE